MKGWNIVRNDGTGQDRMGQDRKRWDIVAQSGTGLMSGYNIYSE